MCTFAVNYCMKCHDDYDLNKRGSGCVQRVISPGAIAGIVIGVIAVIGIAGTIVWYFMFYRKVAMNSEDEPEET